MCCTRANTRWAIGRKELKNLKRTSLVTFFKSGIHFRYNQLDSVITFWNGSSILLLDLAYQPSDPLFLRLGGLEITGALVEESNEVSVVAVQILKSRVGTWNNDVYSIKPILIETFNPDKGHIYHRYYKPWKKETLPPYRRFVKALPTDNPFTPLSYIDELKKADKITRERLLFGNFEYDDDPTTIMDIDAMSDLFSNTATKGLKYLTVDVARFGMDKSVIFIWEGLQVVRMKVIKKSGIDELNNEIIKIAANEQISRSHIIADEQGLGGGVVDYVKCKGFIGSAAQIGDPNEKYNPNIIKKNYLNLRAQCYFMLADYVNKGKIGITCDSEDIQQVIIEDLEQIKAKDPDKDQKLAIISKDDIKEHLGRSPDYSDTLMMRMFFELNKRREPQMFILGR